ncbi:glycosyltransferase [Halapricum sp. CBA1109]|uniref:glycosyltransferase family 4 protein n=1 Tax=Halapricum sp. CBA1109 TaxID=2668068 RepID=UPI0012F9A88F|nr:glycosyltransferase [Halapricum sp. CBA1109]
MHVLSLSLDAAIAERGSEPWQRQREYAEEFDRYYVVTKTDSDTATGHTDGPLTVAPTASRTRYHYLLDAYRLGARYCKREDVDVVTVQDPFAVGLVGWLLSRRFDLALHTQVHTDFLDNPAWVGESLEHRVFDRLGRFVVPRSDAVRVGTEYERRKMAAFVPADVPVDVVPVSMDFDSVVTADSTVRSEYGLGERPVVLFVGRFVAAKDLGTWVDVAARVRERSDRDPVFVLVGDGPRRDAVESAVEDAGLGDDVVFTGWVDPETVGEYYACADVFLITSNYEGTSRVVVEAGMNGLPVVATPFAGAHDNVADGETGFVKSSVTGLADRVTWLLERSDERERFGTAARDALEERFDRERLRVAYVESVRATVER